MILKNHLKKFDDSFSLVLLNAVSAVLLISCYHSDYKTVKLDENKIFVWVGSQISTLLHLRMW